jgi:hypothetical protein
MFRRVARLASRQQVADGMATATRQRDDMVPSQWSRLTAVGASMIEPGDKALPVALGNRSSVSLQPKCSSSSIVRKPLVGIRLAIRAVVLSHLVRVADSPILRPGILGSSRFEVLAKSSSLAISNAVSVRSAPSVHVATMLLGVLRDPCSLVCGVRSTTLIAPALVPVRGQGAVLDTIQLGHQSSYDWWLGARRLQPSGIIHFSRPSPRRGHGSRTG